MQVYSGVFVFLCACLSMQNVCGASRGKARYAARACLSSQYVDDVCRRDDQRDAAREGVRVQGRCLYKDPRPASPNRKGGGKAKGCKEAAVESINFHHHCRQSTGSCARILLLDGWMISDAYVHLCVLARAHTFILRLRQHERGTTHTRLHASRACLANRFVSIYLSTPPVLFVERDRQRERERMCVCVCLRGMCVVCTSSHSCTPPT